MLGGSLVVPMDSAVTDSIPDPRGDVATDSLRTSAAYDALRELSLPLREAVVAVDVLGLSYKDAARALGTKEGTIMSRLHRGRSQVAARLAVIARRRVRERLAGAGGRKLPGRVAPVAGSPGRSSPAKRAME